MDRRRPQTALGPGLGSRGARLPFLLKVLAAAEPLSLQAHPTPEQARAGFAREERRGRADRRAYDRNYRDPFHKPELIVALSETFEALCGLPRPRRGGAACSQTLRDADAAADAPEPRRARPARGATGRRRRRSATPSSGCSATAAAATPVEAAWVTERVTELAASDVALDVRVRDRPSRPSPRSPRSTPATPASSISLLLNRVTLRRGEALYLPAGNIHAYLAGLGVELMAASDNVLRGGLTPKHIDVAELLDVLDFTPIAPCRDSSPTTSRPGVVVFRPDVPDFVLLPCRARCERAADAPAGAARVPLVGPAIVLAEARPAAPPRRRGAADLARGEALYVTPEEGELDDHRRRASPGSRRRVADAGHPADRGCHAAQARPAAMPKRRR